MFQDDCVKISDFSTTSFDHARSFPKLTFMDVLDILEVKMEYFKEDFF